MSWSYKKPTIQTCALPANYCSCESCQKLILSKNRYCGWCGQLQSGLTYKKLKKKLYYIISFFLIFLLILYWGTVSRSGVFKPYYELYLLASLLPLAYAYFDRKNLKENLSFKNFNYQQALIIFGIAIVFGFIVNFFVDLVDVNTTNYYRIFKYTSAPIPLLILCVGVQPALFEELAFRGFLYNNLKTISNEKTAIIISTMMFGVIHLSLISLLWILPIGWFLAYLRKRSGILWYGIVFHFTYNTTVVLIKAYQSTYGSF